MMYKTKTTASFINNPLGYTAVIALLIISSSSNADTICTHEGDLQYIYSVNGTSDNVIITSSGPTDTLSSSGSGYVWYYPQMLKTYTQKDETVTMAMRDGVSFMFTPKKGNWENKSMDSWNRYKAGQKFPCKVVYWGASDWQQIFANPKIKFSSDSLIGGFIIFINEPIAKIYAAMESNNTPPITLPARPTSTIYLNGQVTVTSSCSVSPSLLDIDLGEIHSSANEKTVRKTISVNCKGNVSGEVYIGGSKAIVGDSINIETSNQNATFFIKVNRNDFEIESTSGIIGIDAGIRLSPSATPGLYKGVTYLDLRYN
ncbi:hypothetical protein M8A54_004176 [Salmonella enterica]|nr:hypothetical protein [Salmonella enterica]